MAEATIRRRAADPCRPDSIGDLRLERRVDGRIWAIRDGEERAVSARRLFPWSREGGHISLRLPENEEFAVLRGDESMSGPSRHALEDAVALAGFVFEVTRVLTVKEEIEIRLWRVRTRQGTRAFQTRLDDWPREIAGGGILIQDVAGDLYHIPDTRALDAKSRELLWAFANE
jgi:hypothetical protein